MSNVQKEGNAHKLVEEAKEGKETKETKSNPKSSRSGDNSIRQKNNGNVSEEAKPINPEQKSSPAKDNVDPANAHEDILVHGWLYVDTAGKRQGPFSTAEMKEWWIAGFFDQNLMVKRVQESEFQKIGERPEFNVLDRSGSVHSSYYYNSTDAIYTPSEETEPVVVPQNIEPDLFDPYAFEEPEYEQKGFFNVKTGRFQSSGEYTNHWQKKGLPTDRDGRMMAHYFDLDAYQEQMRELKRQKLENPVSLPLGTKKPSKKAIIAYYKKKKEERKRKKILQNYG